MSSKLFFYCDCCGRDVGVPAMSPVFVRSGSGFEYVYRPSAEHIGKFMVCRECANKLEQSVRSHMDED
jgi:hypothetical protein